MGRLVRGAALGAYTNACQTSAGFYAPLPPATPRLELSTHEFPRHDPRAYSDLVSQRFEGIRDCCASRQNYSQSRPNAVILYVKELHTIIRAPAAKMSSQSNKILRVGIIGLGEIAQVCSLAQSYIRIVLTGILRRSTT